jgi:hypothetical protein
MDGLTSRTILAMVAVLKANTNHPEFNLFKRLKGAWLGENSTHQKLESVFAAWDGDWANASNTVPNVNLKILVKLSDLILRLIC